MTRRALASIVGVAVVAVALFGIPLTFALRSRTQQEEMLELDRAASRQAVRVSPANLAGAAGFDFLPVEPEMRVGVYDMSWRRISGAGPAQLEPSLQRAGHGDIAREQGSWTAAAAPVVSGAKVIGITRAAESRSDIDRQILKAWSLLGLLALAVLGVTAGLAYWQSRRLTRPLIRLAAASTRLGDGDFTVRNVASGIPEIDAVGRALDSTAVRLGDALERERSFGADASHQLRTPLTGLRLTLERAELGAVADSTLLGEAVAQVDRLDGTITQLLTLARDTHHDRAPVDPAVILGQVERHWRNVLERDGRALRVTIEHGAPIVRASSAAITQVLDALLDNARCHGAGTVAVRARGPHGALTIDVSDEGPGITGDTDRIFVRRQAADADGRPASDGRGIGLALARRLAEAEGGRLVLSSSGPHPRFSLVLPRLDEAPAGAESARGFEPSAALDRGAGTSRVALPPSVGSGVRVGEPMAPVRRG